MGGGVNMLNINEAKKGERLDIALEGRLDTPTAPQLEEKINSAISDVTNLTFDFTKLEYISSAGLRVLLSAQKVMNKQGKMTISNVSEEIMEIFEVTGFSDILTIQ
jgi:anti-sigma B factor antagonist